MRAPAGSAVAIASSVLIAAFGGAAEAHQFEHPKVLRVGVKPDRLLVSLSYDVNPGDDARLVRSLFDRNADGVLDAGEQKKIEKYLEETSRLWLRVTIGGTEAKLERLELAQMNLAEPRESTQSLGITAVYQAPISLGPGERAVAIEIFDRDKDRARHVPLTVDVGPAWDVAFASQGELHPKSRQIQRILLGEGAPLVLRLRRTSVVP